MLVNLAVRGPGNLGVCHGELPVEQEAVLLLTAGERLSFECVVLNVVDSFLNLALVASV